MYESVDKNLFAEKLMQQLRHLRVAMSRWLSTSARGGSEYFSFVDAHLIQFLYVCDLGPVDEFHTQDLLSGHVLHTYA